MHVLGRRSRQAAGWIVAIACAVVVAIGTGRPADAQQAAPDPAMAEAAEAALHAYIDAVRAADRDALDHLLAADFQIVRADGTTYARTAYIDSRLPAITDRPAIEDLVLTAASDTVVASYVLVLEATVDGTPVARRAPRLTVLRGDASGLQVVAHANFAAPVE